MRTAVADSFLHALAYLSTSDVKRAMTFLENLIHQRRAAGLRPKVVHYAARHAVRSLKVTHDLRAIAHFEGDRLLLSWVTRHDQACVWAREHRLGCDPLHGEVDIVEWRT